MVQYGFLFPDRVIGMTPRLLSNKSIVQQATGGIGQKLFMRIDRAWEILEWLQGNQPIESFVILDDDSPFYSRRSASGLLEDTPEIMKRIMQRFVQTDQELGLLAQDAEKAKMILLDPIDQPFCV
jgi:hypothetical protein